MNVLFGNELNEWPVGEAQGERCYGGMYFIIFFIECLRRNI